MKLLICAVRDSKAAAFMAPIPFGSKGLAVRALMEAVKKGNNPIAEYKNDHSIWHLGYYDDNTGELESCTPELIAEASEMI